MNTWATTIISGLVLVVAFMQWRTAHQKVVLDLFEKRMKILSAADVLLAAVCDPDGEFEQPHGDFRNAIWDAQFLFGKEVSETLLKVEEESWKMRQSMTEARHKDFREFQKDNPYSDDTPNFPGRCTTEVSKANLVACYKLKADMVRGMAPYLRMDQKLIRTPMQWLKDRNRVRLSYADEKQR